MYDGGASMGGGYGDGYGGGGGSYGTGHVSMSDVDNALGLSGAGRLDSSAIFNAPAPQQRSVDPGMAAMFRDMGLAEQASWGYAGQNNSWMDKSNIFDKPRTFKDLYKDPIGFLDDRPYDDRLLSSIDSFNALRSPKARDMVAGALPGVRDVLQNAQYAQDKEIQNAIVGGLSAAFAGKPGDGFLGGMFSFGESAYKREKTFNEMAEKLGYGQDYAKDALGLDLALRADSIKNKPNGAMATWGETGGTSNAVQKIGLLLPEHQPQDPEPSIADGMLKSTDPYMAAIDYINERGLLG